MSKIEGIVKITIDAAKNLPCPFLDSDASTDAHAVMVIGKKEITRTKRVGGTRSPVWDHTYRFFCRGKFLPGTAFTFNVYEDDMPNLANLELLSNFVGTGHLEIEKIVTEQKGEATVELKYDIRLKAGTLKVIYEYTPTSGVPDDLKVVEVDNIRNDTVSGLIRFYIEKATDLKKTALFGTCDPYVVVSVVGPKEKKELARSQIVTNTTAPIWQFKDAVNISGTFLDDTELEFAVLDDDLVTNEKLGTCSIPIYDLFTQRKIKEQKALQLGNDQAKGELYFQASFKPAEELTVATGRVVNVGDLFYQKWVKDGCPQGGVVKEKVPGEHSELDNPRVRGVFTCLIGEAVLPEGGKSIDTYVVVRIHKDKITKSQTVTKTNHPVWNHKESVFLEGVFLDDTKITFSLYKVNALILSSNSLIDDCIGTFGVTAYDVINAGKWKETVTLVDKDGKPTGITLTVACGYKALEKRQPPPYTLNPVDVGDLVYNKWKKSAGKV